MSIIDETRFVERLQFFNGQRLFASDLQGVEAFNREMRWLHNQSLHQPGVGNGFAVSGEKEAREVTIGAGYAIDSLGREIVLTETVTLPIPPVAGNNGQSIFFDLTVAYPDDANLEEAETRDGVCLPRGVTRLREAPIFCWVELAGEQRIAKKTKLRMELLEGRRIRLARIEVFNCKLNSKASTAQRLSARPAMSPYIASGVEKIQDVTGFTFEVPKLSLLSSALAAVGGLQLATIVGTVDTAQAGFITTPEYSAHITGPRQFSLASASTPDVAILDQLQITKKEPARFEFFGPLTMISLNGSKITQTTIQSQILKSWEIVWMGVEG